MTIGTVTQPPLYGCIICYEDHTVEAQELRVYDGECWCYLCWVHRSKEANDKSWHELEPFRPAPPCLDDDAIARLALKHVATNYGKIAHEAGYQKTEQFRRIKALVEEALTLACGCDE